MDKINSLNVSSYALPSQVARLKAIGIELQEPSLAALLCLIPAEIHTTDCMGNIKPYQWKMWRNKSWDFEYEGVADTHPATWGMMYETFSVMSPDHPIAPRAPHYEPLYDDDGDTLIWSDESPVEMAVQALEWLAEHHFEIGTKAEPQ